MSGAPSITIMICTRNRVSQLGKTLQSLSAAIGNVASAVVEVVIVDNGSGDHTQAVINDWGKTVSFPVQNILEPKPGLSIARNAGIASAKGRVIVFTDDDCTLNPDYLVVLKRYLAGDTVPVIRGGRVELGDPTDAAFTILLGDMPKRYQHPAAPSGFIIGANMVIPSEVFTRIGLFDERFGAGAPFKAGEESDFVYRAHRAGIPVDYVPDLIVKHFHGRKDKATIARLSQGYFLSSGAMYAKYISDTLLLRHLYWDIKKYLRGLVKGDTMLDKDLGITYGQLLCSTFKGMALYIWVAAWRGRKAQ